MEPTIVIQTIIKTNHPSQKEAARRYYQRNKAVIQERLKKKYNEDPEFRARRLEIVKKYLKKRKEDSKEKQITESS